MSLEQFIQNKAQEKLRNKLQHIAHEFKNLIPDSEGFNLTPSVYRSHAETNGSNILTDCFGVDFPEWVSHPSTKSIVREYVELLILAFGLDGDGRPINPESVSQLRKSKLSHITDSIMENMESAMKEEEPETSITIKGKGITIDGK